MEPRASLPSSSIASSSSTNLSHIDPQLWLKCWSTIDDKARMILTPERVLLWAEEKAYQILTSEDLLRIRNRRVEACNPAESERFDKFLKDDRLQDKIGEAPTLCLRSSSHSSGDLLLRAGSLTNVGGMDLIGICMWRADTEWHPKWIDFQKTFDLTTSEAKVIDQLLSGLCPETIAEKQQLSIDTVRTHIRHAYQKLAISKREGLWKKLAPYRLN
jgi:DNA-binding CsgD family transcriptional regulator